jgi:hypothetical protein
MVLVFIGVERKGNDTEAAERAMAILCGLRDTAPSV